MPPELDQPSSLEPAATLYQPGRLDQEPTAPDTIRQVMAEVMEAMFFTEAELTACEHAWLGSARCARILTSEKCCWEFRPRPAIRSARPSWGSTRWS